MPKRYENNIVLVFGDTHAPYMHKNALEFLADTNEQYKPERVVHLGDLLDVYSVSAYPTDPDHPDTWTQEIQKARVQLAKLYEIFPDVDIMESNHDDRAYKKARLSGIPREYLIPFRDVVGAPPGWTWHDYLKITVDSTREQLFFAHTRTGGAFITALDMGCTTCLGHSHSLFGAKAFKARKKTIWGVDAGCLISDKGSPFKYNKGDRGRPIQGCVLLVEGRPILIQM